jgi:ketosteroid isomerase-like protein
MRLRFLLFFAILTQTVPGQQPVPFPQLRQTWIAALESRDLKASLALSTPNAAFIDPDGTRAATPDALRQLYTSVLFNSFTSKIQLTSSSTDQSGDLAFDSGSYAETVTERANQAVHHWAGDYLTVYRRSPDGRSRIIQQVWTQAPPPPTA